MTRSFFHWLAIEIGNGLQWFINIAVEEEIHKRALALAAKRASSPHRWEFEDLLSQHPRPDRSAK